MFFGSLCVKKNVEDYRRDDIRVHILESLAACPGSNIAQISEQQWESEYDGPSYHELTQEIEHLQRVGEVVERNGLYYLHESVRESYKR